MRAMRHWSRRSLLVALPLLALAFMGLVWLSSVSLQGARLDLTEHGQYTLSPGTLRILDKIPEPITLQLYWSEKAAQGEPQFRIFAQRVRELLQEVASHSHGKVKLQVIDPEPFSDAEDKAAEYGLQGVPLGNSGDTLYFGLVGSNSTDGESVMPFIQPDKEAFLEYDIARLLTTLSAPGKPVLALLSGLPQGPGYNPLTGQARPAWVMDRQLSEFFDIRRLQANPGSIGDDVSVLMVVHPKSLEPDAQYAIDQFVLRGGHLLVFVDPDAESDPGGAIDPTQPTRTRSSDLPILFASWGLEYDPGKVVLDAQAALQVQPDPAQPPVRHLAILGLKKASMNQKDVVTADLESLNLSSAGAINLRAGSPLRLEPLVQSSSNSALAGIEAVRAASSDPTLLGRDFKPDGGGPYVLAARL
ncbi:MAG: GldG family protein, partial [Arenimonas sp.]